MRYKFAILLCFTSINASANVLQYFAGLSYHNPAELFKVKKMNSLLVVPVFMLILVFKAVY